MVIKAETAPAPLRTAAGLLERGSREVSAGPCISPQRHKSGTSCERNVTLGSRPFCEELKCSVKGLYALTVQRGLILDRGMGGKVGFFNSKISFKKCSCRKQAGIKREGCGQDLC